MLGASRASFPGLRQMPGSDVIWPAIRSPASAQQPSTVSTTRSPWQLAQESLLTKDSAYVFPLPIFQRNVQRLVCHQTFGDFSMVLLNVFRVLLLPLKPWRRGSPGTSCRDMLQIAVFCHLETTWIYKNDRWRSYIIYEDQKVKIRIVSEKSMFFYVSRGTDPNWVLRERKTYHRHS